jgi:hypothetical protein
MADFFLMLLIVGIVILVQLPGHQYGPSVLSQVLQFSILVNFLELLKFQRWFLLDAALLLFLGCISLLLAWLHLHWESGEEAGLRTRIARSCLAFVFALLPLLLGLVLFLSLPRTNPYLVLVDKHGPGQDKVEVALVGAHALHTPSDLTALAARSLHMCAMFPLSTKSCLKSSKLRPISNGQFCHAISKNIFLNVLGSTQPREILAFVILKL